MRIAYNVPALMTHIHMRANNRQASSSMNKLSTGLRINSAREDAAGLAIANKLSYQITGLERANSNSNNGVSLIQTAEGALGEVHSMLQRMRELAVSASNDTMVTEDRERIKVEVDELMEEINMLASRTEFNTIKLLNGEASRVTSHTINGKSSRDFASTTYVSENMPSEEIEYHVEHNAKQATMLAPVDSGSMSNSYVPSTISINGITIDIDSSDLTDVWNKIRESASLAGVYAETEKIGGTDQWSLKSIAYGSDQKLELGGNASVWKALGFDSSAPAVGEDIKIKVTKSDTFENTFYEGKGNRVELMSPKGHSVEFVLNPEPSGFLTGPNAPPADALKLKVEEYGPLRIQVGANYNMSMDLQVPRINTETLGFAEFRDGQMINQVFLTNREGAERAIGQVDEGIARISRIRSRMGAYQNRLEQTMRNLDNAEINTTGARSRIQDTDVAKEMTKYSQYNVMFQAGLAIMGQANQRPQMLLSLLQ